MQHLQYILHILQAAIFYQDTSIWFGKKENQVAVFSINHLYFVSFINNL